jgi:predicted  nucleic acid-binding Zn-ribbon protein
LSSIKNEINLSRYKCAQCGRTPQSENEVFNGCICGHRLFRIVLQKVSITSRSGETSEIYSNEDKDFLTIREREIGIYEINVEKLLDEKTSKKSVPIVAGNKGIFSIRLDSHK